MQFWKLEPEVAAELGDRTDLDTSTHPPKVAHLHLRFAGWLGDDLIECFPCFAVTDRLAQAISAAHLTGCRAATLEMSIADELTERQPEAVLPVFRWLIIEQSSSSSTQADFSTDSGHNLVVSERALQVLRAFHLDHCEIEPTS